MAGVADPVDAGTAIMTDDRAADGGKYGAADIVTKEAYGDHRLHVEFYVAKPGGNSGVYIQNRFEIQILDGDKTSHGMGAVINESESPYHAYNGAGKWNAYDIVFRAARFKDGKMVEKPLVSMYFNGIKVHTNVTINQVHGGPNSGVDGGNDGGKGITDSPQGLKLQCEGHDVRYRNIWIEKLDLAQGRHGLLDSGLGEGFQPPGSLNALELKSRPRGPESTGHGVWTSFQSDFRRAELSPRGCRCRHSDQTRPGQPPSDPIQGCGPWGC
jgi:hypothetical protein